MTARSLSPGWFRSRRRISKGIIRVIAVAGLLVVAGFGSATTAAAHSTLERTNPGDGSQVATVPSQITLTFNQNVLGLGSAVEVTGPDGSVTDGAPTVVDKQLRQAIQPGAVAGDYSVLWRVTSADGHPISGKFTFSATASAPAGEPSAATTVPTSEPVAGQTTEPAAGPTSEPVTTLAAAPTAASTGGNSILIWLLIAVGGLVVAGVLLARRTSSALRAEPDGEGPA